LIAAVWSSSPARGSQAVERRPQDPPAPIVRVAERFVLLSPLSPPASSFRLAAFPRKAVLEETQIQVAQNRKPGPIPLPYPLLVVPCRVLTTGRSLASLPLRC